MTTIALANVISQRAAMLLEEHKEMLARHDINTVLKELGLDQGSLPPPAGYTTQLWKEHVAKIILEKWEKKGIRMFSQKDIVDSL